MRWMSRPQRRKRKGLTFIEVLITAMIMPVLIGSAMVYMRSGAEIADMTSEHAMWQQSMRRPIIEVSHAVETSEEMEILAELPTEPLQPGWALVFASGDDSVDPPRKSVYIRELSGGTEVDRKIHGFDRISGLQFERKWYTSDGSGVAATSHDAGLHMTLEAKGKRLVDGPGGDAPSFEMGVDLRSLNKAPVVGEESGPVLKIERDVLTLEFAAMKHVEKDSSGKAKRKADGHVEILSREEGGDTSVKVGESYFGIISIVKGALDRELEYEWRVYDTKADARAKTGYAVIGKEGSATKDGDSFFDKDPLDPDYPVDFTKLYDDNTAYVDDDANAYTYFEKGSNKIIENDTKLAETLLVITPGMEGKYLALAARDATRPNSEWQQSGLFLAHDIGLFGNVTMQNWQQDVKDGGHRVALNVPGGEKANVVLDYTGDESFATVTVDGNIEVPIVASRLARRFFAHAREPKTIDGKEVWVRSREFCQENYTLWLDIQVGGADKDGNTTSEGTGGWGITLNGNTSRDMTMQEWDRTFGYLFQWDPGLAGDSSGLGDNRWKYVGGGHVKANADASYSYDYIKKLGLHHNFEYYYNRSLGKYFMDLSPSNGQYRVAEGLIIRELPGLTNTGTAGISDIVRVHKIPKEGTDPKSGYFDVPSDPDTQLYSALFDQIKRKGKGGVTIRDIRHEDVEMKGNVTMRKAPDGLWTTAPRYEQLEYDDDDDDRNDISAHQWYTRADADWKEHEKPQVQKDEYDKYKYLEDRLVAKVVDEKQMRYYQWGDLVYWPSPGPGLKDTLETTTENYQLVSDDECDLYRKDFGLEPVDPSKPDGDKRFVSMSGEGKRYTVAINVVTQTKAAPTKDDPDRTVPVNLFCRVRVFDGVRRRVARRYERRRPDDEDYFESQFRLADGTWDEERWPVRRFPIEDDDGNAYGAQSSDPKKPWERLTGRSRDAWFGFTVATNEAGDQCWIPTPIPIPKGNNKAEGPASYLKSGGKVNFWTKDHGFIWNPRRMLTLWKNENYVPSDKPMWAYRRYENEGWTTKVNMSWSEEDRYTKGHGLGDTKELLMENPDKWWFGNADSIHRPINNGGRYPYRKILGLDRVPTAKEKSAYQRQEAFIVGPAVKTHYGEQKYNNASPDFIKGKEGNDPNGDPNWLMVDGKVVPRADKTKKVPHGNNIMAGDVFYRVREDGLMIDKVMKSDKHGGSSGHAIGQDLALRIFAPRMAGARAQAKIYFWNVERGFPEDYVFPWGQTLKELLPDGKGASEPAKGRGDWNWYQAFEPRDGVKETAQEGLGVGSAR